MSHTYFLFDFDGVINPLNRIVNDQGDIEIFTHINSAEGYVPDYETMLHVPGLFVDSDDVNVHWSRELVSELDSLNTGNSTVVWASTWLQNAVDLLNPEMNVNWDTIVYGGNQGIDSMPYMWKFFALEQFSLNIPEGSVIHWVDDVATKNFVPGGIASDWLSTNFTANIKVVPYLTVPRIGITRKMVRTFKEAIHLS